MPIDWRIVARNSVVILLIGGFFYYLWSEADKDTRVRNAKQAEYDAKAKADRDATARLLADPAASKAEIEKRLTSWITAKDEIYILEVRSSSGRQTLQTIPRSRAWSVKCTGGVLMVEFPTITADEDDAALTIRLLPGSLDAQKCREYAELVASRMAELTHAR